MARRKRRLSASDRRHVAEQITAAVPRGKGKAITHARLWRALEGSLKSLSVPKNAAQRVLRDLRSQKAILASTRVGLWRPGPEPKRAMKPREKSPAPPPGGRRVRKVVVFVCTTCYRAFASKPAGRAHWFAEHGKAE